MSVYEQETAFVKRFIVESKQDRYLLFLSQLKTRKKFLDELYHRLAINNSLATELPSREHVAAQVEQRLRARGAGILVYVISTDDELDQQWLPLSEVLTEIVGKDTEAILCCLPGRLAFYQSEDSAYILHYQQ